MMILVGNVACLGKRRDAYRYVVDRPKGRRLLGRSRHK